MNKIISKILLLAIILCYTSVSAQDKLLFLNGKELKGKLIEKTKYEFTFTSDKGKQFIIDKYRVFSYSQKNNESIVYEYDTLSGNFLSVKDMRMFVYGEKDAQYGHKTTFVNTMGLAVGGAMGYLMHRDQSFLYVPTPLLFTSVTLLFPTKVREKSVSNRKYVSENEYLRGYERIARSRRTQNALKSSILGMGIGFLVGVLVNPDRK